MLSGILRTPGAIGWVTFTEILRDKVLYNVIVCAALLFGLAIIASQLSVVNPGRVVMDLGYSALSLSSTLIAVFIGAGMIGREFERRTVHIVLARPIARWQFVLGKFVGISGVVLVNWVLLTAIYLGMIQFFRGYETSLQLNPWTLAYSALLALLLSLLMGAIAIFFSTFTTTSLAVVLSVGTYLIGQNVSELRAVVLKMKAPQLESILLPVIRALPNLEHFNLGPAITYQLDVGPGLVLRALAYAVVMTTIFIGLAGLLIERKEL